MVIRCERCSTLYELDEALLSIEGSQVQCTRCQHVFTAYPRAAGRTSADAPAAAAQEPARAPAPDAAASHAGAVPPESALEASPPLDTAAADEAAAEAPAPAPRPAPQRVVRTGPPPVYRPSTSSLPTGGRAPLLRRDAVGTFESRLRWSARWRWLAPVLLVAVAGVIAAVWVLLSRRGEPESASRERTEAAALLALDDAQSVEQAISRLDALLRRSPGHRAAEAERALAQVLRAAALADEGERLAASLAARSAERARLGRDRPDGWEEEVRAVTRDVETLEHELKARDERVRSLGAAAIQVLRRQESEHGGGPEIARGLAAYHALAGERDRARAVIRAARDRAPADPWLDLAEGWVDARDPDRAARERGLVELGALSVAHPEVLRGRYLRARTEVSLGRQAEAIRTLDALLAANPRHEAGRHLREELSAPPAPPPAAPASRAEASAPIPPEAPPPANPAPHVRKVITHTVPATSPAPSVTVLPTLMPSSELQEARPVRRRAGANAAPAEPAEGSAASPAGAPAAPAADTPERPPPAGARSGEATQTLPGTAPEADASPQVDGG